MSRLPTSKRCDGDRRIEDVPQRRLPTRSSTADTSGSVALNSSTKAWTLLRAEGAVIIARAHHEWANGEQNRRRPARVLRRARSSTRPSAVAIGGGSFRQRPAISSRRRMLDISRGPSASSRRSRWSKARPAGAGKATAGRATPRTFAEGSAPNRASIRYSSAGQSPCASLETASHASHVSMRFA